MDLLALSDVNLVAPHGGLGRASTQPPVEAWALHASRRLVSSTVTAFVNFVCDYYPDGAR